MIMFDSESELLQKIAEHDDLVRLCAQGKISFSEFRLQYKNFYSNYALDGHESDEEEKALFRKHKERIDPHLVIEYEILGKICSDSDAGLEVYKNAGRIGSAEAVERLKEIQLSA
ncbi:hypothetical protein [Pseudomonas sp. SO81]|uniref:hypothetical protein n=1 Tax=Pseudomonas sp. SO81 TaxID=2983246 RepID=UPI0025A3FD9B|nr:hypothetical protein [Pseudomonas sp. SO81]WJN57549.1 hypothetical protein OH686_02295 [Pseudomonas sp. SO81]